MFSSLSFFFFLLVTTLLHFLVGPVLDNFKAISIFIFAVLVIAWLFYLRSGEGGEGLRILPVYVVMDDIFGSRRTARYSRASQELVE